MVRGAPKVRLVPMTDAEREETLARQTVEYAEAKARAGIWAREESLERSRTEIRSLVGERPSERGHEFYVGTDERGRKIGWIWLGPVPSRDASPTARWLFQIVVEPEFRGHGFGRSLLRAAEEHALATHHTELALNVFRWNAVAVSLYSSSGYAITFEDDKGLEMRKRLGAW